MSSIAHTGLHSVSSSRSRSAAHNAGLHLAPTADGCALVTDDGRAVFAADGRMARRDCLRWAARHGVLRLH